MFKVGLEDYTVFGKHGAYEAEHAYEQPFTVSIWVELKHHDFNDALNRTINYADLQKVARQVIANTAPIKLMETMFSMMFDEISKNQMVSKITIRIEKPKAELPYDGGLAIVEGEWPFRQEI